MTSLSLYATRAAASFPSSVTPLVLGVLAAFPRPVRLMSASVHCPLGSARAERGRLRVVEVTGSSLLGGSPAVACDKPCLSATAPAAVVYAV
jgi:hypothetical protein